jgi:hypothetical protein
MSLQGQNLNGFIAMESLSQRHSDRTAYGHEGLGQHGKARGYKISLDVFFQWINEVTKWPSV